MKKLLDVNLQTDRSREIDPGMNLQEISSNDIAIIGVSAKLPFAHDLPSFWNVLRNGKSCVSTVPEARQRDIVQYLKFCNLREEQIQYAKMAFLDEIDTFDYSFFQLSPKEASLMDPNQRLFLQTAWNAIEDAGYGGEKIVGTRTGVYVGYSNTSVDLYRRWLFETLPLEELTSAFTGNIDSIIPSRLSYLLNLRGPALNIDTACSSSLVALHCACQGIRNGECDQAIVGSVNIHLLPIDRGMRLGIESADGRTKTFDDGSDGTGSGEGAIAIVLKPLNKALEDRDSIYAVVKGTAVNQDGRSNGITAPNPLAQADVLERAWQDAGVSPESISYIEAHGTGTRLGDPIEIMGIDQAFKKYTNVRQFCAIGSVKSNIGHLNHAAGLAGIVKVLLALKHKQLPPTIHFQSPNREILFEDSPVYVNAELQEWDAETPRRCGISSFAINGTNCHVVVEEAPEAESGEEDQESVHVFTLSAHTRNALRKLIHTYDTFLEKTEDIRLLDLCYTANTGRGALRCRIGLLLSDLDDLKRKIKLLCYLPFEEINQQDGIFFGEHKVVTGRKAEPEKNEVTEQKKREYSGLAKTLVETLLKTETEKREILQELCHYYSAGAEVEWEEVYRGKRGRRVHLPVYPFERERCWLHIPEKRVEPQFFKEENQYYTIGWEEQELPLQQQRNQPKQDILLFTDSRGIGDQLSARFRQDAYRVIEVTMGESYEKYEPNRFRISGTEADYLRLCQDLDLANVSQIIHCLSITERQAINQLADVEEQLKRGVYSLFYLTRAIGSRKLRKEIDLVLISNEVSQITRKEELNPEGASLFGLGKVVRVENLSLRCRVIDIDQNTDIEQMYAEINAQNTSYYIAYRGQKRYLQVIRKSRLRDYRVRETELRKDGTYVITGGLGKIGLEIGKYFATKQRVNVVLINRTPMPAREKWKAIVAEGKEQELIHKIKSIQEIETLGAKVVFFNADVSRIAEMEPVLAEVRKQFGQINGVVHLPVVKKPDLISQQMEAEFTEVVSAKVHGAWIIDQLTQTDSLDFLLFFSSVITLMGGFGVGGVTAAHSYLDAFTAWRNLRGKRTISIKWSIWKEIVNIHGSELSDEYQIFQTVSNQEGMDCFAQILNRDISEIIVGKLNYSHDKLLDEDHVIFNVSRELKEQIADYKKKHGQSTESVRSSSEACKVDLVGRRSGEYSQTEITVGQAWADVLGYRQVNIFDNFYESGGDSISANKIINLINRVLDLDMNIVEMFKYQTVESLAEYIDQTYLCEGGRNQIYSSLQPVEEQPYYALSSAQKRFFIINQISSVNTNYNMPNVIQIKGNLDPARVEATFQSLVERHESLRTSFHFVEGEPVQKIHQNPAVTVEQGKVQAEDVARIVEEFIRPFDLSQAPLLRVKLLQVSEREYFLIFDMHHIISDAVSMNILIQDFLQLYQGLRLSPLQLQYKDFAHWQNRLFASEWMQKQEEYWIQELAGEIPVLNMPTDYPRPTFQSFVGDELVFTLGTEITRSLHQLTRRIGATLFMVLLAAYNVLLAKYTGQDEFVIGSIILGRSYSELEQILGLFMNTLALRNHPQGEKTFTDFVQEVKECALRAYENQDYPYEALIDKIGIKRDLSRNPLFDTMFILQNVDLPEMKIDDLTFIPTVYENKNVKLDIILEAREFEGQIYCYLKYCTGLYKRATMERFAVHFGNLLQEITRDPEQELALIDLLSTEEKREIVFAFNETSQENPGPSTIHQFFEEQVKKTPGAIAVVSGEERITFQELHKRSNQIAHLLRQKGTGRDQIVGLMVEPSVEMIIGILGIIKSGGAYLPLNPEFPVERIGYMVKDSGAKFLLTQSQLADRFKEQVEVIDLNQAEMYSGDVSDLENESQGDHLVYLIYTSGTTGNPKGVLIQHSGLVNYVHWLKDTFAISAVDKTMLLSSFSFDLGYTSLYSALLAGAELHLVSKEIYMNPEILLNYLKQMGITYLKATPSLFSMIVNTFSFSRERWCDSFRFVILGGEKMILHDLERFHQAYPDVQVMNHYGPTEATIGSIARKIDFQQFGSYKENPTIGKPIRNARVYILDQRFHPVPVGVVGEIYLAGAGLAKGYLNRPDLTDEKFVIGQFADQQERLYKTGDLGRYMPDGQIEFLGRIDHQVKIRGYRVELQEIEKRLLNHPAINEVVVIHRKDERNSADLCAYYVAREEESIVLLREFLAKELPDYMIPAYFIRLEQFPLTPNGKIDQRALPEPDGSVQTGVEYVGARNTIEETLVQIWEQVLRVKKVGILDNFFTLGGDSIKAMLVMSRLLEQGLKMDLKELFQNPTIADLSKYVMVNHQQIDQGLVTGEVELTVLQKKLFTHDRSKIHHRNQAVMVYRQERFDVDLLRNVFQAIVTHHDALRMVYPVKEDQIIQFNRGLEENLFVLDVFDFEEIPDFAEQVVEECNRIQRSMDLENGPLVRLGLFRTEEGDHLLVSIHHLVVDGVSWRIILEDFATGYQQLLSGQAIQFPRKSTSFQSWAKELKNVANSQRMLREKTYWKELEEKGYAKLPKDQHATTNYHKDSKHQSITFTREETEKMLGEANRAYNTKTLDLLLTALGITMKEWVKEERILVSLEGHGREKLDTDLDITRTVGWFTSMYPVILDLSRMDDLSYQIRKIKEDLRHIPNNGIGYGILQYLTTEENKQDLNFALTPEISFNYLGQFDHSLENHLFQLSELPIGQTLNPELEREYIFYVEGIVVDGQLSVGINYNRLEFQDETVLALLEAYKQNLLRLMNHCLSKEEVEVTPIDLENEELTIEELEDIMELIDEL